MRASRRNDRRVFGGRGTEAAPEDERENMGKLLKKSIGQVLREQAAARPDRPAVTGEDCAWTYAALNRKSDALAASLLAHGVEKGTHVGIWADDRPETLLCFYAVWKLGAVAVPLCTAYTKEEMNHCIRTADVTVLLVDGTLQQRANAYFLTPGLLPIHTLLGEERPLPKKWPQVTWEDADTILFTSGSAGKTKPVITTHFNRVNTMYAQANAMQAGERDRFCMALPLYHCFSLTANALAALAAGACACFPENRRGKTILDTIQREKCTILTAVPTLFSVLLRRYREGSWDLSSLRTGMIGGSSYSPGLYEELCRTFQFTLLPSLGQTEATAGITSCALDDSMERRMTTVGQFFPGIRGCIKSTVTGKILPCGSEGEICIKGFNVMQGYYMRPVATSYVIDQEGWLHTGDLGRLDEEGYLTYVGRKRDIIIRGGENIAPGEIEDLLHRDIRVQEAKVIGVPDPHYTEEVCACVVAEPGVTAEELRKLVCSHAAAFKAPRYVLFFDDFPLLGNGKLNMTALRRQVQERLEQHAGTHANM